MKKASGRNAPEFREITPFYMKHSYSHYRYDPNYDSVDTIPTNCKYNVNKERYIPRPIEGRARQQSMSFSGWRDHRHSSDASLPQEASFQTFSSNLLLLQKERKHSKSLDDNIQRWNMRSAMFSELPEPDKSTVKEDVSSIDQTDSVPPITRPLTRGSWPQLNKAFANVQTHSYHDQAKVNLLRQLVHRRLERGDSVAELAKEPLFEDVLDICDENHFFPAYEAGTDVTFQDYRALRKCKYLRLSEKNITSLKEATLNALNDEEE